MSTFLKVSAFFLFVSVITSCEKSEDPNAFLEQRESVLINVWLEAMLTNGVDIDTTSTGLYYIVDKEKVGTGATVKAGNTVTVKYTGKFIEGGTFDSSESFTFVHKDPNYRMIQGWEEGIEVLNKGAKAVFLIPSAKGYGAAGYSSISPYSPLIFIIEVVDIK